MSKSKRPSVKFKLYRKVRKELSSQYPELFPARTKRPPLKVGILKDIVSDGKTDLSTTQIRFFLSIWTTSTAYLKSVARGQARVGLRGEECGRVERAHEIDARKILTQRNLKRTKNVDTNAS